MRLVNLAKRVLGRNLAVLHDDMYLSTVAVEIIVSHNIRMVQVCQNLDLILGLEKQTSTGLGF